jgi:hypothetical protein
MFDCCFMQVPERYGSKGFTRKVVGEARFRLFATSLMRVVCAGPVIFCFTQGSPKGWLPGS